MIQANTNNRWARLSQSEKAELLGIYASKGYHDLANIIAHYNSCGGKLHGDGGPEGELKPSFGGEIRQGKKWNFIDHYLADNPQIAHGLRKTGVLIGDAARVLFGRTYKGVEMDPGKMSDYGDIINNKLHDSNSDSFVDRMSEAGTPLGAFARAARPIINDMAKEFPNWEWSPRIKRLNDSFIKTDRLINMGQFIDDFATPVEQFKQGGQMYIKPENYGRMFEEGGPEKTYQDYLDEYNSARSARAEALKEKSAIDDARRDYIMNYNNPRGYWYWTDEGKRLNLAYDSANEKLSEARKKFDAAEKVIGEKTLEKYAGTAYDPMYFWDYVADTKDKAEKYYKDRAIRESAGAKEVADYFNSYANSPGYQRIRENQRQWWINRHPYRKIWQMGTGTAMESTDWLQDKFAGLSPEGVFDISTYPDLSVMRSGNGHGAITVGTFDSKEFPYWFTLPHEMAHISNAGGYATSTLSAQKEALDQNTNTEPGHDSRPSEKHSDKEALMFMLYKEGIYDSRGEKDCTPEDIAKLRKKYPDLRPLQQMDDEKAAWMINHVADAGNQESLYDNHLGNISANGGKIHIKPENRGKFTALKERTGHSASWFKEHGTPAQKKMAIFALNARKWKHEDGGPLANYLDNGGPYGVIPLGSDYLTYLQNIPEVSGGMIEPSVVTAALPAKFNGSQAAATRYAEGYQKGAKPVSDAMNRAGQDIFNTVDTVIGLTPTPAGAISWLGHMGADAVEGEWGKVGRDVVLAAALGAGARGIGWLKNYVDDATNFGEDIFRAFTDGVPGRVSTNFTYAAPATRAIAKAVPAVSKAASTPYEIENLGGGYMLKSLMRGNPLEKQLSKNGTVNVNNVRTLVGKGSKVEQAVVDKILASEEFAGKKAIDYNKFRKAVQDELITYERTPDTRYDKYGMERIGFLDDFKFNSPEEHQNFLNEMREHGFLFDADGEVWADELTGQPLSDAEVAELNSRFNNRTIKNTYTFSSPRIPNGSGKHYDSNTLGHSRTYTTADEPDILHVMESQSDWAQSGKAVSRLEIENQIASLKQSLAMQEENLKNNGRYFSPKVRNDVEGNIDYLKEQIEEYNARLKDAAQSGYLRDNYTSRQIQENLRYAAEKGQTKMRYPTRETAAKIEGYPEREAYFDASGRDITADGPVYTYGDDVDKRIAEINKRIDQLESNPGGDAEMNEYTSLLGERMRLLQGEAKLKPGITKKTVYDYEDILRKYTDFPKQYKKLYKGADVRIVTDPKGNTWYEVDVPEGYLGQEWTYKYGGPLREFANISDLF